LDDIHYALDHHGKKNMGIFKNIFGRRKNFGFFKRLIQYASISSQTSHIQYMDIPYKKLFADFQAKHNNACPNGCGLLRSLSDVGFAKNMLLGSELIPEKLHKG
jgi:hypothetical protein